MHRWKATKFSKNSKAVKYYVYVLSNWRMHRLSQYFDIPTQMNTLVFRSLESFTLICFDRDKKFSGHNLLGDWSQWFGKFKL